MKDFIKIFLVLCGIVASFFYGRSYGEKTLTESSEMKNLRSENYLNQNSQAELDNLKTKFQSLLDSSDLKKADEILGKVMTIFLADLGLRLSEAKQNELDEGKRICLQNQNNLIQKKTTEVVEETKTTTSTEPVAAVKEKDPLEIKNLAQFKGAEFAIHEAQNTADIRKALEKLEVKKIDSLLDGAADSTPEQSKKFLGSYRGTVVAADKTEYGTLVMNIEDSGNKEAPFKGVIQLFRGGNASSTSRFTTSNLGFAANNSSALIVNNGSGSSFLQLYKIEKLNKVAAIYYDRLPNGTSKTLGTVILSRTDFVD
jgi:hypothetical protein